MAKLLVEQSYDVEFIKEDFGGEKHYHLRGIFLQAAVKNRNGRIYPLNVMEQAVRQYEEEYIDKNAAFCEYGHGDSPIIDMPRVSHLIKSLRREGNDYIGHAVIINEGYGKIASALLDVGASFGISSKGCGTMVREGSVNIIQSDFILTSGGDIVAMPSAQEAYVDSFLENEEWYQDERGEWVKSLQEDTKQKFFESKKSPRELEEVFLKSVDKFLKKLSNKGKF
jgi:hypothetical protein